MDIAWKVMIVEVNFAFFDVNFGTVVNGASVQEVLVIVVA
jgi:hypothetical protein